MTVTTSFNKEVNETNHILDFGTENFCIGEKCNELVLKDFYMAMTGYVNGNIQIEKEISYRIIQQDK